MIPALSVLPAKPRRIVLHWTGGTGVFSTFEKRHYHYGVQQDLQVVAGVPVAANMRQVGPQAPYAAHTRGYNSYSVGVAFCGMRDAVEGRNHGSHPLTLEQVEVGCAFVAELCRAWNLRPNEDQVFTHAEAQRIHGKPQSNKWDVDVLPFRQASAQDNATWLRARVQHYMREAA